MIQQLSNNGINFLKMLEGCNLTAYKDSGGVLTIGFGHTKNVQLNTTVTYEQAIQLLMSDLIPVITIINADNLNITQEQFDALVILIFNIGCGAYQSSTLRQKLILGNIIGAAAEFTKWYFDNGTPVRGLLIRRLKESLYFLKAFP